MVETLESKANAPEGFQNVGAGGGVMDKINITKNTVKSVDAIFAKEGKSEMKFYLVKIPHKGGKGHYVITNNPPEDWGSENGKCIALLYGSIEEQKSNGDMIIRALNLIGCKS